MSKDIRLLRREAEQLADGARAPQGERPRRLVGVAVGATSVVTPEKLNLSVSFAGRVDPDGPGRSSPGDVTRRASDAAALAVFTIAVPVAPASAAVAETPYVTPTFGDGPVKLTSRLG